MIDSIIKFLLFFFVRLFPKKKNLIVFGDRAGLRYADNSRHLYQYLIIKEPKFECIWISKDKKIIDELNKNKFKTYYSYSLKGIYFCLRANWHVYNFVENDILSNITLYSNCILLWHGVLPKKVNEIKYTYNWVNHFIFSKINKYFVYPNSELSRNLIDRFPENKYKLLISNLPRNLILEKKYNNFETSIEKNLINNLKKNNKIVFGYFPTWRQDGLEIFRDVQDFQKLDSLDETLKKQNSIVLLKKHMNSEKKDRDRRYNPEIEKITDYLLKKESFLFVDYSVDLNTILKSCDVLITDYSGVVFDFLYLKKPIIFYAPDYEDFKKNNGFEINVIEKQIGYIANNINELNELIKKIKLKENINDQIDVNCNKLKNEIFPETNNGIENIIKILRNN